MTVFQRFQKKLGDLNANWNHTTMLTELPLVLKEIVIAMEIRSDDFIVFSHTDPNDWFGIHTNGIYKFGPGKILFIDYNEISSASIVYLENQIKNLVKENINKIKIITKNQKEFILICDTEGAVFTIKRLIDFGMTLSGLNNK